MTAGSKLCTSFKRELLQGLHVFDQHQFMLALYTAEAPLDPDQTTSYIAEGEVDSPGYAAGGQPLTGAQLLAMAQIAYVTFADAVWPSSSIAARAALLYNATSQNRAVAILDFGGDRYSNQGNFQVQFPPPGPVTALIRVA